MNIFSKIFIHPLRKIGNKKVVHVTATDTSALIEAGNLVGVGVRNAGTPQQHITVKPNQARTLEKLPYVQKERDMFE